jgi:hypothetical protein
MEDLTTNRIILENNIHYSQIQYKNEKDLEINEGIAISFILYSWRSYDGPISNRDHINTVYRF